MISRFLRDQFSPHPHGVRIREEAAVVRRVPPEPVVSAFVVFVIICALVYFIGFDYRSRGSNHFSVPGSRAGIRHADPTGLTMGSPSLSRSLLGDFQKVPRTRDSDVLC